MKIFCVPSDPARRRELFRMAVYLAVGGWNTLFGVVLYIALYRIFGREVNYLVLAVPANILAITNAFLGYKYLVFRTRGNFWREYFRCYIVYGGMALLGIGELWLLVSILGLNPEIATIVGTAFNVAVSYVGHRNFSFRAAAKHPAGSAPAAIQPDARIGGEVEQVGQQHSAQRQRSGERE